LIRLYPLYLQEDRLATYSRDPLSGLSLRAGAGGAGLLSVFGSLFDGGESVRVFSRGGSERGVSLGIGSGLGRRLSLSTGGALRLDSFGITGG
jgi:hypothetical protein